jgi:hypothetical protein
MICTKCESNHFRSGVCMDCAQTNSDREAFIAKMMNAPEWSCPNEDGEGRCTEDSPCEDCCEHQDMDDAHCMDCGKDRTEDLSCAAYDRMKNRE